ncbi:MAG: hypothetical protein JSW61_15145 [Candidatus Thorarchaeota archaeon]|nr:MAG: hypothetical protein JSW61_15145 [Candidatus Thorarchaeota archaeon]
MEVFSQPSDRDLALIHALFAVIAAVTLLAPIPMVMGDRILALVIVYSILILYGAIQRGYREWIDIWLFSIILSMLMIMPDWFLVAQLNVLTFPVDGTPMIGPIPLYMGGLWAIPFFIIIYLGNRIEEWVGGILVNVIVALIALIIFGIAEATLWALPSWQAQNVFMIGHVAVYILFPEMILGLAVFVTYAQVRERQIWRKIHWAFLTMLVYMGSISFFYFLIERIILQA